MQSSHTCVTSYTRFINYTCVLAWEGERELRLASASSLRCEERASTHDSISSLCVGGGGGGGMLGGRGI